MMTEHKRETPVNGNDHDHSSIDEKIDPTQCIETVTPPLGEGSFIPPEEIQARFDMLRGLSADEMADLNKKVLRKVDWHMMPCVTLMFLMKYVSLNHKRNMRLTRTAISTASMFLTRAWLDFKRISTCRTRFGTPASLHSTLDILLASSLAT